MKNKVRKPINFTKERVVLSDTLPYETPLTFSNRHFYSFLNNHQVILSSLLNSVKEDSSLEFSGTKDKALVSVLKLLFQVSSRSIRTEIRFHDFSGLQHAIDEILKIKGWSCFEFTVGTLCSLKIIETAEFNKLIEIVELKKEYSFIKKNGLIINVESSLVVTKILEYLVGRHHEINLLISTRTLNCKTDHTALVLFKEYYVLKANSINLKEKKYQLPFTYRISHKENDYRELSIPHPKNQLEVIAFYDDYKELILYYSRKSSFTIRKPEKVASYVFVNDDLHKKKKGDQLDFIEENGKEYDTLKTFFTYKRYPNIHKFYEDYKYHRAEKKYNFMYKFDIAKCFDSIYTHSISWALYDKNLIKDNLSASKKTFPGRFDNLMQNANFGETNGILIGPEFSRIFSELILQRIDRDVEDKLSRVYGLHLKKDYEIYRYVDDYFVFYNDEVAKVHIMDSFKVLLKEYKMSISDAKSKLYLKPLITGLTVAKSKIIDLFEKEIKFKIKTETENAILQTLDYRCNSNNLITKFKIIITEAEVDYKDIMNFTLALIHKRVEKCISDFELYYHSILRYEFKNTLDQEKYPLAKDQYTRRLKQENVYTNHLLELLDFTFFIYTVNPRVNFTIRLCHILSNLITSYSKTVKFFTGKYLNPVKQTGRVYSDPQPQFIISNKDLIYKKISDEIRLVLEKNKIKEYAQIESLYLLIVLQQLGKEYRISQTLLYKYFQIVVDSNQEMNFVHEPNYFVITVLLFYIRNAKDYSDLREIIKKSILQRILREKESKNRSTECVLIVFDILVCPYLEAKFKREVLGLFLIIDSEEQNLLLNFYKRQKYWFTKWDNFNFADELEAKIAHEPY